MFWARFPGKQTLRRRFAGRRFHGRPSQEQLLQGSENSSISEREKMNGHGVAEPSVTRSSTNRMAFQSGPEMMERGQAFVPVYGPVIARGCPKRGVITLDKAVPSAGRQDSWQLGSAFLSPEEDPGTHHSIHHSSAAFESPAW